MKQSKKVIMTSEKTWIRKEEWDFMKILSHYQTLLSYHIFNVGFEVQKYEELTEEFNKEYKKKYKKNYKLLFEKKYGK